MATPYHLASLLEKLSSPDSDYRFMSLNDLSTALASPQLDLSADPALTMRLVDGVVISLTDNNGEVQNLAVKCLPGLLSHSLPNHLLQSVLTRISNLPSDVAATAIRSIIPFLPQSKEVAHLVVSGVLSRMKDASNSGEGVDEVIMRFGKVMDIGATMDSLGILTLGHAVNSATAGSPPKWNASTKRGVGALSLLASFASDEMFSKLISSTMESFNNAKTPEKLRILVSLCNGLSKNNPTHFGGYIKSLTPFVLSALESSDDDVKETALATLDTFQQHNTAEMKIYTDDLISVGNEYLKYDPNYAGDGSDEEMDDDDEFDYQEIDFSDDEDISWKLRRMATKLLSSVIITRHDLLSKVYEIVAPNLISSFSEREENVRVEILHTFGVLIRQTDFSPKRDERKRRRSSIEEPEILPHQALAAMVPKVAPKLAKQLLSASLPTQAASLGVLRDLAKVLPGSLEESLTLFVGPLVKILNIGTSTLRIDALQCVTMIIASHPRGVLSPFFDIFVDAVVSCIADRFYKVSSEALLTSYTIIKQSENDLANSEKLFAVIVQKINSSESDLEVRDHAITALGLLLQEPRLPDSGLQILLERLCNETTRLVASKAIETVANERSTIPPAWAVKVITELASLLRKSNRSVRSSALLTLKTLSGHVDVASLEQVAGVLFSGLNPILYSDDLQLLQPALHILETTFATGLAAPLETKARLVGLLSSSSPFAATILRSTLSVISLSAKTEQSQKEYMTLLGGKDGVAAAKAVGEVINTDESKLKEFTARAKAGDVFAIYVVGQVGRYRDVDSAAILHQFENQSEESRVAAATAYGEITSRAVEQGMKEILERLGNPDQQILALQALKEALVGKPVEVAAFSEQLWPRLLMSGERAIAAECLGRITMQDPYKYLIELQHHLHDGEAGTRGLVVSAIRYTFTDNEEAYDDLLRPIILDFLQLLSDEDLDTKKTALATLNAAAHNKLHLITDHLSVLLPLLYTETEKNPSLVREVQMGPFKHEVDDGLDARKIAYETMFALLETTFSMVSSIDKFFERVVAGLGDDHDIKILCLLMLQKLCRLSPESASAHLDAIISAFRGMLSQKVKENAVKQDVEKLRDLQNSVLRSLMIIDKTDAGDERCKNFVSELRSGSFGEDIKALENRSDERSDRMET